MEERMSAHVAEYNRLWEDMRRKWDSQQQLTNQIVYLTAAFVAVSWFILREGFQTPSECVGQIVDAAACQQAQLAHESSLAWARRVWLAAPIVFATLSLLVAYHDRGIRQLAVYVYSWLRREVETSLRALMLKRNDGGSAHVWHWDGYWYEEFLPSGQLRVSQLVARWDLLMDFWYAGSRYGLAMIVSIMSLTLWWVKARHDATEWIGWAGFGIASALTLLAVVSGSWESWRYRDIRRVAVEHRRGTA